jgi:hypothetical protein
VIDHAIVSDAGVEQPQLNDHGGSDIAAPSVQTVPGPDPAPHEPEQPPPNRQVLDSRCQSAAKVGGH